MQKDKVKKDRIFILVAAVVVANLSYQLAKTITGMVVAQLYLCPWCWTVVIANSIAIIAMLWLLQNYRRRRRVEKQEQEAREKQENEHLG